MWLCSRTAVKAFGEAVEEIGIPVVGFCCGNRAHYIRTLAETLGKTPAASKFSPDMTQHTSQYVLEDGLNEYHLKHHKRRGYNKTVA